MESTNTLVADETLNREIQINLYNKYLSMSVDTCEVGLNIAWDMHL